MLSELIAAWTKKRNPEGLRAVRDFREVSGNQHPLRRRRVSIHWCNSVSQDLQITFQGVSFKMRIWIMNSNFFSLRDRKTSSLMDSRETGTRIRRNPQACEVLL